MYATAFLFLDDLPDERTSDDVKAEMLHPKSILVTFAICQLSGPMGLVIAIFTSCSIAWARLKEK